MHISPCTEKTKKRHKHIKNEKKEKAVTTDQYFTFTFYPLYYPLSILFMLYEQNHY